MMFSKEKQLSWQSVRNGAPCVRRIVWKRISPQKKQLSVLFVCQNLIPATDNNFFFFKRWVFMHINLTSGQM